MVKTTPVSLSFFRGTRAMEQWTNGSMDQWINDSIPSTGAQPDDGTPTMCEIDALEYTASRKLSDSSGDDSSKNINIDSKSMDASSAGTSKNIDFATKSMDASSAGNSKNTDLDSIKQFVSELEEACDLPDGWLEKKTKISMDASSAGSCKNTDLDLDSQSMDAGSAATSKNTDSQSDKADDGRCIARHDDQLKKRRKIVREETLDEDGEDSPPSTQERT